MAAQKKIRFIKGDFTAPTTTVIGQIWEGREVFVEAKTAQRFIDQGYAVEIEQEKKTGSDQEPEKSGQESGAETGVDDSEDETDADEPADDEEVTEAQPKLTAEEKAAKKAADKAAKKAAKKEKNK